MKQLIFSFLFLVLFSTISFAAGDPRLDLSVKSKVMDKTKPGQAKVTLELKNMTGDTLTFLTWSCDPIRSMLYIDEEDVSMAGAGCTKNFPMLLKLLPHLGYTETIVVKSSRTDGAFSPFKIKMTVTEPKEKYKADIAKKEADKKKFALATEMIDIK
jgi:hypothetical protein